MMVKGVESITTKKKHKSYVVEKLASEKSKLQDREKKIEGYTQQMNGLRNSWKMTTRKYVYFLQWVFIFFYFSLFF